MTEIISTPWQWTFAILAALTIGVNKAGIKGIGVLFVVFMALALEAKQSTGIVLPLLIIGDIAAVIYYNKHAKWSYLWKFLPWMAIGVVIGAQLGNIIPADTFRYILGCIVLFSVFAIIWWDKQDKDTIPTQWYFGGGIGILAGMATMIGNLAGPLANIFFLAMKLPKNQFIGTAAWLFFLVNLFKVPFHIFAWKTITWQTLLLDLKLVPFIFIGLVIGIRLVRLIKEKQYRQLILILTAIGGILIFIR